LVAVFGTLLRQRPADELFVVNNQDLFLGHRVSLSP
jgi:hypothetical protein